MRFLAAIVIVFALLVGGYFGIGYFVSGDRGRPSDQRLRFSKSRTFNFEKFTMVWGALPPQPASASANQYSNIEPQDYVGADTCAACHEEKYRSWSQHPHRWMNAAARPERVFGEF